MMTSQPVAIKFVSKHLAGLDEGDADELDQEPRKAEEPQLRDEYRSYRTLNGTRK